jgi:hypothetical protein
MQLDLDPSEFGAGFRIVPAEGEEELHLDIYLYDTLSGGGGYAELAGGHLTEILNDTLSLLEGCAGGCDRSCESCLRHYHNQHLKGRLDRHVGAQLLRYGLLGQVPRELSILEQGAALLSLRRLLELDGFTCTSDTILQGIQVPLLVSKDGIRIAVGIQSGLLDSDWNGHSLYGLASTRKPTAKILNEYILRRNLPEEHQLVREMF